MYVIGYLDWTKFEFKISKAYPKYNNTWFNECSGTSLATQQERSSGFVRSVIGGDVIMMTSSNGNIFRVTGPLCGEFTGPGEFPTQRPVTRSFNVSFDLRLYKWLSKQPWGWWFETLSWSIWRHCNDICHQLHQNTQRTWGVIAVGKQIRWYKKWRVSTVQESIAHNWM